jgi:hypothetical protein
MSGKVEEKLSLTPQQMIGAARKVFDGQEECWLTCGFVYQQLCRYPQRFGFESLQQLPLPVPFERIIKNCGHFDAEQTKDGLLFRPRKEMW